MASDLIERLNAMVVNHDGGHIWDGDDRETVSQAVIVLQALRTRAEKAEEFRDAIREERNEALGMAIAAELSLAEARRLLTATLEIATRNEDGGYADEARRFLAQEADRPATPNGGKDNG